MDQMWNSLVERISVGKTNLTLIAPLVEMSCAIAVVVILIFVCRQLRGTRKAQLFGNVYVIQKEAREITAELRSDERCRTYIFGSAGVQELEREVVEDARLKL